MLLLGRGVGQTVFIGDSIAVTVMRMDGDAVRIGISAPRDVDIVRGELLDRAVAAIGRLFNVR